MFKRCFSFRKSNTWIPPGFGKDMLHTVHQGVALHAIAGLVTHHYEELYPGLTIAQLSEKLSCDAWPHYRTWCKGKKTVCPTSSTFTSLKFGRESWQSFPELSSCYKGAMVKFLIFWAAEFLADKLKEIDTETSRLRAFCAWSLAQFQYLQDTNGPWLSGEVAKEMAHMGRSFLIFYQKLAVDSRIACPEKKCTKWSQSSIACYTFAFLSNKRIAIRDTTIFTKKKIS